MRRFSIRPDPPLPARESRVEALSMPVSFAPSSTDLLRFAPETILTIAGTMLMVLDPLFAKKYPKLFGHLSILALIIAIFAAVAANSVPGIGFSNLLIVDSFGTYFRVLVLSI